MLLLRNADLYDPTHVGVTDVFVVGSRVAAIGPGLEVGSLPVEEIDLDGAAVVPGLVDGHVHVTGGGGEEGPASSVAPLAAEDLLDHGVTSVVGLLGTDDVTRSPAALLRRVKALRAAGLGAWAMIGGYHLPVATVTGSVRGDLTTLDEVVGVGELAISDHRSSQPTLQELLRVGADVHVGAMLAGRRGTVHLHVGDGEHGLNLVEQALGTELPARLWHPTHVNRLPALLEQAWQVQARGVTIDVTAFGVDDEDPAVPAADAVATWLDAGRPGGLTLSSDSGGSLPVFDDDGDVVRSDVGRPDGLLVVVRDLVARGYDLAEVLPVVTSAPATQFGIDRGHVHTGASADLLVLDTDLRLRRVLHAGTWHTSGTSP